MMVKLCPKCGREIPPHARWGICPSCLLAPASQQAPEEEPKPYTLSFSQEGRHFGNYQLVKQIGRGGMGVVYEALDLKLRRTVALKMILDSHTHSPCARRRFAIEAEAAAKLDHPNIVPIYEVGEHGDQQFLSMKLVQGENLREKIASGELCVAGKHRDLRSCLRARQLIAARLMALVARAVHHAHEHGVLHRDLKPGNIIVDWRGQPHLIDFGLAKLLDQVDGDGESGTHSAALMGTVPYMSPEQASNQPLSAASDVYGLGAILYQLLTGHLPFKAGTMLETIRRVAEQEPERPRAVHCGIDAELETVCLKCLQKSPAMRYDSALGLAEDLERWLRQEPIRARPAGPVLRVRRWIKRNPLGAGLIASLCVALCISLLMYQMAHQQSKHLDILAAIGLNEFTREVENLWAQPDREFVELESVKLAALNRRIPREPDARTKTLKVAVTISDNPIGQATAFAPFLGELQRQMEKTLNYPVLLNLKLYKRRSWNSPVVWHGDVDVQRVDALTYVRLTQAGISAQPLARSRSNSYAVVFARRDTGIASLRDLTGRCVAFAHTNSIVSLCGKAYLARNEIWATNLKAFGNPVHLDLLPEGLTRPFATPDPEAEAEDDAHRFVMEKVLRGACEAGVSPERLFLRHSQRRPSLIEVGRYTVPRNLFVAKPGLDRKLVLALRQALASITNKKILGQLGRGTTDGFAPAVDSDYDEMRQVVTNDVPRFENCLPASTR